MATWNVVEGCLADGLPMRAYLAVHEGEIWRASLHDDVHPRSEDEFIWRLGPGLTWTKSEAELGEAMGQVREYFGGQRQLFDLSLRWHGTAFQRRVWEHLRQISYGETLSYGELAEMIGHPAAFRAVGNANGKNNLALVVPCHRVLAAGGKIGGYTGGLGLKRRLLAHEAAVSGRPSGARSSPASMFL